MLFVVEILSVFLFWVNQVLQRNHLGILLSVGNLLRRQIHKVVGHDFHFQNLFRGDHTFFFVPHLVTTEIFVSLCVGEVRLFPVKLKQLVLRHFATLFCDFLVDQLPLVVFNFSPKVVGIFRSKFVPQLSQLFLLCLQSGWIQVGSEQVEVICALSNTLLTTTVLSLRL